MDFHGMKRKNLQTLCKKHGIPANLKNIEMATRLASVFQKETVNISEDSFEAGDGSIKDDEVVSKEAKRVRFSPENEVFEFTRSVKNCKRRNELVKNNVKKDVQTNTQDRRRSIRLKARAANSSMGDEISNGRLLCSAKESKKGIKTKQSKGTMVVNSQESELVKNKTKEPLIDCEVQSTEKGVPKVEKVPRRSNRLRKDINVLMDKRPVKTVEREKSLSELLVDTKLLPGLKQTALDNSPKSCSVVDCERDGASSVYNVKKSNVNDDDLQVPVKFTRNSLRHDSFEAPIVVEGNLVENKTDEILEKKWNRSAELEMDMETTSTQSNLTPKRHLDQYAQFEQEEAGGNNVESGGFSKKPKTMNQECVKDKPQGMIEDSPSSFETNAAESVMVIENVLDSTPEKSVDSSQRTNTQELNSELMEGKCEEQLERDTILMPVVEEDKEEVSSRPVLLIDCFSPALVPLAISNPEAELVVPTGHTLVKDIAEENTETKEEIFICGPISELKEHSSVAKSVNIEAILENSAECWKEIHLSNDEKGSLEKKVKEANFDGHSIEYNTENKSAEEEMEIMKNGYVSVGHCVNLTPEKLLDEYSQLEPEEAGGANVEARSFSMKMNTRNQELVKEKPQGVAEMDSPSTSEAKATESVMISENVLDSTLKSSDVISLRGNTQELDSELMEGEREEKHEQDTVLVAAIKEKEVASLVSVFLIERAEVSNPEVELFVETTLPPASVQLAVSNHEVELGVPTAHMFVKDIASTVITNEDIKTKEEILISLPISELKEHTFVAKLAEAEAILDNSAEISSHKDDEKVSLEKKIQSENIHGNFSEYNTENSEVGCISENSKVGCLSVGHYGNLESLDEVKDDSHEKTEQTISRDSGCKLIELELRRLSSTDFTSLSPKEDNVSKCFEEDGTKALSQPLPRNKDVTVFDESAIFTTPERNLMLMEQLSENGKTPAADSVTHHKDEAVESHVVVFTTPMIVEVGKEEDETATNFLDETDARNTTERFSMSEGSRLTEARNDGECKVMELHEESVLSTGLNRDQPLADSELGEAGGQEINSADKSGLFTSLETQLVSRDSEQQKAVKTGEKVDEEFCDDSYVPNIPETQPFTENSEMDEAAKSEEDKAVELQVECGIFTSAEKHLLLETDEEMKGDHTTTNSHVVHDVFIASESQSHMGEFEPDEAEKTMNVELLGESNTYKNPESHLLFGESVLEPTRESFVFTSPERQQILVNSEPHSDEKEERNEVEFKDESAFFSKLVSGLFLGESGQAGLDISKSYLSQYQSHYSCSPKFDFRENTIVDSSGSSMASKISYNLESNVGQETAVSELMKKGSQAEDVEGLDATQGKSEKKNEHSPHVDSVNLLGFDIEEAETIMKAERNVSCNSYVLALPTEGNSETVGEISSSLEVAGTCSMVSDFQNQIHEELEEMAITDNNETNELIEAKVQKNIEKGNEGNLLLNSSGGTEDKLLGFDSEVVFGNTCENHKFLEDEAADSISTAFGKAISLTCDEPTVQNNINEKAADEEMIRRETTPSPEETLNESSEIKEYLNIDESGTSSEKQVRREPILVYRTQVKLKRHDMKENAPNPKIVDNLNVTAPRTSKRQPLQELRKN